MGKAAMVETDIHTGAEIVDILEQAGVKVAVAAWMLLSEYGDWRFVVSARKLDFPDLRNAYGLIREALDAAGFDYWRIPPILVLPTTDPTIRQLRRIFGKAQGVRGLRLGGQLFGDRFVENGYVYRLA